MKIYYIVIALQNTEVDQVIETLRNQKKLKIAEWLKANKAKLYGNGREDWKPFMDGKSIRELLEMNPAIYQSSTSILDKLKGNDADVWIFDDNKIQLVIIDIFALFLQKYIDLAKLINTSIYKEKYCLIVPYDISQDYLEIHNLFIDAYNNLLGNVYLSYMRGALSRIVGRTDDLTNYIKYLSNFYSLEDSPNPASIELVSRSYFPETQRKDLPRQGG